MLASFLCVFLSEIRIWFRVIVYKINLEVLLC